MKESQKLYGTLGKMCCQSIHIIAILRVCDTEEQHVSQVLFSCLMTRYTAHLGMHFNSVGHIYLLTCGAGIKCLYSPSFVIIPSKLTHKVFCKGYLERLFPCLQSFHAFRIIGPFFFISGWSGDETQLEVSWSKGDPVPMSSRETVLKEDLNLLCTNSRREKPKILQKNKIHC